MFPVVWNGAITVWVPRAGLDRGLGKKALFKGATAYAEAVACGFSGLEAHRIAERVAYQEQYRVVYS